MVLCGSGYERARFEACRQHATLARAHFGEERRYVKIVFDVYLGLAAMAQGRVREAAAHYASARRSTRRDFSSDPCLAVCVDAVMIELDRSRRVRLLAAQGEFAAVGEVAAGLRRTASELGLTRTLLRGLALSMVVAERAGQADRAEARLVEFLRLTRDVDYVRPLVRERETSRVVLRRLPGATGDADVRDAATSMLARLDETARTPPSFSPRELQVLAEVQAGRRNREIAGDLGISADGVRFHLKNIYRKTGARHRADAVRNAQSLGILD